MKKYFLAFGILLTSFLSSAQDHGFEFGRVSASDFVMKVYPKDTSASAVVLYEFGEAYIDNVGENNLLLEYHVKIKILKKSGLQYADIEIPLWKQEARFEKVRSIKASSFNIQDGNVIETPLDDKNIFTVNKSKSYDIKKFAIPNVQVGSVIEFMYTLESPYIYNFRRWEFQSDIPKIFSEYWATIPANYSYNITLRGFYKLDKNESELLPECFTPGAERADCVRSKYAMKDIPAFIEEDYMTARSNFLSAINFELSEIKYFDGRRDKITKEWKDAEQELQRHAEFGIQLKRGEDIVDDHVKFLIAGEGDELIKAKRVYDFIKHWYNWDDTYGKYSVLGIKKAFERRTGNVGDINLSLIAALKYAGLNVEPVILSTRSNGVPVEFHPVLSDFNYVIAKVNIGTKVYLADATDDYFPFGLLPDRCLNGKGRVLGEKQSYWIDLKPADRAKHISMLNLKLNEDGKISGTIQTTYIGYEAVRQRKKIDDFSDQKEYIRNLDEKLGEIEIKAFELKNDDEQEKPFIQKLEIEMKAFDEFNKDNFLFDPFVLGKWEENPFKSSERLYPIDFGMPIEFITVLTLEYPSNYELAAIPEKAGLTLPNAGGRYIYDVLNVGNKLSLNTSLSINKTTFSSTEYHYLKELFTQIIQMENADLIFRRKG
jgi:hypothetical protein